MSGSVLQLLASLWPPLAARKALLCLPGLALVLTVGIIVNHPGAALIMGSGALSVGFGSFFPDVTRHRTTPMLLAGSGMALSAAVGSLAGHSLPALLTTSILWSMVCAWLIAFGTGAWWIVLQWAVGLFVSSAYVADLSGALARGGLILCGAAAQFGIVWAFWRAGVLAPPAIYPGGGPSAYPRRVLANLRSTENDWSYVFAAGATVAIATLIERAMRLPNGYWAPMTGLIVIRADLRQTRSRVIERILGTLAGAGLATLAAEAVRPTPLASAALIVAFAWSAYGSRAVNYAAFTASITGAIVFLLSLTGRPEPLNALYRVAATLLGALLALCVRTLAHALISSRRGPSTGHGDPHGPP